MTPSVQVKVFENPGPDWRHYMAQNASSCLSHDPRWGRVFHRAFGHQPFYLHAFQEDQIVGVLPLVGMSSRLFGRFMVSMPYLNHGSLCADSKTVRDALLGKAIETSKGFNAKWIELRQEAPSDWPLLLRQHKVSMRLPLPRGSDALLASFPSKLRSQIRRAEKAKLSVRSGGTEEVESFYRVFNRNMRDLGTPVYPKRFFETIMGEFPEQARIFTVYGGTEPVASGLVMGFKDLLEIPWASSIQEFNPAGVNMLLYWSVLAYACDRSYRVFDFGRSSPGSGTYRFKAQWGAKPVQLYWYYWTAPKEKLPNLSPENPKYAPVIKMWRHLPLSMAGLLGPLISKHVP